MEIPLPLVTKPTISSPGTGLQHFEKRTATSWMPLTTIPPLFFLDVSLLALASFWTISSSTCVSVISAFLRFSYSSDSLLITCPSFNPPCPTDASMDSQSLKPYLRSAFSIISGFVSSDNTMPFVLQYVDSISFPFKMLSSFNSCLNHWLILLRACVLLTILNQSRLGPLEFCDVIISIRSPLLI